MEKNSLTWGLIPFFFDGPRREKNKHIAFLELTILGLKKAGVDRIVVVDDYSKVLLDKKRLGCDLLSSQINRGKTGAVLLGLEYIIRNSQPDDYIIQCDYDADQNSEDAKLLLLELNRNKVISSRLVIGDRYKKAQVEPLVYRKVMLRLQKIICENVGYDLEDTVSGLRGYTIEYAKSFFAGSKSKGFGSDTEQLVIAYLTNTAVTSVPLTYSRRRGDSTSCEKLIEVMNAVLVHEDELRDRNIGKLLDLFMTIEGNLKRGENIFQVSIDNVKVEFIKGEKQMYTATIS